MEKEIIAWWTLAKWSKGSHYIILCLFVVLNYVNTQISCESLCIISTIHGTAFLHINSSAKAIGLKLQTEVKS